MSKRPGDLGYAAGWCIHYRSPSQGVGKLALTTCEAGVEFKSVQSKVGPTFRGQPCFLTEKGESKPGALPCAKLRRPTPEEIAAHEQSTQPFISHQNRMDGTRKVMAAILPWRTEHKTKRIDGFQTIDCPACGGTKTLSMSITACNEHVHARCTTADCVSWTE